MGRRRRVEPEADSRSEFLDRLTADPAGARAERESRAQQFWATRAATAARELAQFEPLLGVLRGGDLRGAQAKADLMRRTLAEAAGRAGLDAETLLAAARAEAAEQDGERTEAQARAALGIVEADPGGEKVRVLPSDTVGGCQHCRGAVVRALEMGTQVRR